MTTIVLADDHPVVRQGLRAALEAEPDFSILGEAADGLAAIDLVKRLKPNVLIVDVMMPGVTGLEVTRQLRQACPQTRVLILSIHANEGYVLEALRNGAAGYALKGASVGEVVQAVREVAAGRRYLSAPLSNHAIEAYVQKAQTAPLDRYDTLTTREREVLHLAAEGYSQPEIAALLGISPRTAETHRTNLMRKLGLRTQTDLVRYAYERGVIALEK